MKNVNKFLNLILPLFTILFILVVWAIGSKIEDNEFILPTVGQALEEFFVLLGQAKFYRALFFTVLRSFISFIISFILSGILAYLSSKSRKLEKLILPFISVMRALPTIAIAWLLVFWTNNQVAPVVITMLVVFPTSYTHVLGALNSVDKTTIYAGKVDGADWLNLFLRIELPQIAPDVCSITGSGIALNFKLMVAAEVLGATVTSLGTMFNMANYGFEVARTLALTIVVLILGLLVELLFNALSKKVGEWK